jgi:succinate dehydrogenase/fumarate reductase flavoprotein subunit
VSAPRACDLLVAGSGAGALATAVTAAHLGLKVLVAEKHRQLGGTTAWSGGWMWVPRNPLAREAGIRESVAEARTYLRHELGPHYDAARVDAFLAHAPAMVDFFRRHTALRFIDGNAIPDFHGRSPAAREGGRSVCAAPLDGRALGPLLGRIREPLDLASPWGMGIAAGADLRHFMNATRAWPSFRHAARRLLAHWRDCALHGRGMHLVAGNALVAGLVKSADALGVECLNGAPVERLVIEGDRVRGAVLGGENASTVRATRGVVLACGGFPHDPERIAQLFAHARDGRSHWSAAPPENSGDGIRLGAAAGGAIAVGAAAGAWAPVSLVRRADGSTGHFPHLVERGKPGLIAVTRAGRRFVNEADSYYDFMSALFAALPPDAPAEAWLVCDHRFIRRYGLGFAKPAPFPLGPLLADGYLRRADSLQGLARACGIDVPTLSATVERFNGGAQEGVDPDFGRGETAYNRMQGDADHRPNPCVAPIERAPFYAVRVVPGSLGTFAGLACDAQARVLDARGDAIPGLYAAGNDMASVMGGRYPSGGITLGPAMTFGYLAAHHAAGVAPVPWPDD